ncbi:acyltransferase family protein, partial [Candidatus Binatus sp.]|uniref:acyltransferase family protein n=1 Tax=Candidatus Binatus sp. TaxID=2811406 RepID=UPI003BAEF70D
CWIALIASVPAYRASFSRPWSGLIIGVLLVVLISLIALNPPLQTGLESFLVPLILIGTVLNPGLLFSRILETSPLRWIGKISYSLYIWQQLFLGTITRPLPLGRLQEFPLNIVAVFVCAAASYYLLERPLVAIGHSLSSALKPPQDQTFEVAEPAASIKQ